MDQDSAVQEVGVDDEECRICRGGADIGSPLVSVGLRLLRTKLDGMHASVGECCLLLGGSAALTTRPALHTVQLHPCKCAGSIRYVHQECLDEWLSRTNSVRCELCHQPFLFSPVYAPNTPDVLSLPQFVVGECLCSRQIPKRAGRF